MKNVVKLLAVATVLAVTSAALAQDTTTGTTDVLGSITGALGTFLPIVIGLSVISFLFSLLGGAGLFSFFGG